MKIGSGLSRNVTVESIDKSIALWDTIFADVNQRQNFYKASKLKLLTD